MSSNKNIKQTEDSVILAQLDLQIAHLPREYSLLLVLHIHLKSSSFPSILWTQRVSHLIH